MSSTCFCEQDAAKLGLFTEDKILWIIDSDLIDYVICSLVTTTLKLFTKLDIAEAEAAAPAIVLDPPSSMCICMFKLVIFENNNNNNNSFSGFHALLYGASYMLVSGS